MEFLKQNERNLAFYGAKGLHPKSLARVIDYDQKSRLKIFPFKLVSLLWAKIKGFLNFVRSLAKTMPNSIGTATVFV
jgi:hypothetical protein